mgnify:CR=1 FL=1
MEANRDLDRENSMEPYILSAEDIAKLQAANISSAFDAEPGMEAAENEIEFLNGPSTAPMAERLEAPEVLPADVGPNIPLLPASAVAAPASAAPAPSQNNMALIQQLLAAQTANSVPKDPYESLSKTQRRMLAFAGLSDAGAALQGRSGVSINNMMSRFNEQADMQRKAAGAQAQQKMMQGLMGGDAAGGDPQARIQQLLNIAMVNPSMAPAIALQVKNIQDQVQALSTTQGQADQASTQLEDVQTLLDMIQDDPFMTTGIMSTILGGVKATTSGQAVALQKTLKSNLALEALKALKATGATMGALNTKEFEALETQLTNLDLGLGAKAAKVSLLRIQDKYQSLIADAFRDAKEQAEAGNPMGKRGLDGLTRIFGGEPEWLGTAPPLQITIRPNENEEEFKKRMGL